MAAAPKDAAVKEKEAPSVEGQDAEGTDATEAAPQSPIDALVASTRQQFVDQLEELRPSYEAFVRIEQIVTNFDAVANGDVSGPKRRRRNTTHDRAARGTRSDEFLALVRTTGEEGISVTEAADKMDGINDNYLYRIAKTLTEEGKIEKREKRYYAAA